MSHGEIWDDSALVNSWNEALEEYKRYHSIHARGEKVEEVLKSFEGEEAVPTEMSKTNSTNNIHSESGVHTSVYVEKSAVDANGELPPETLNQSKLSEHDADSRTKPSKDGSQKASPPLLQNLVGSVQDQGLKNLLMSWYYAGYYTGLREGQQQGT